MSFEPSTSLPRIDVPATTPSASLPRGSLRALIAHETRRHVRRRIYIGAGLVAAAALAVVGYVMLRPKPLSFAARFRQESVTSGDIVRDVQATGRLEALVTVSVGAEISGRIAQVEADYNQHVKRGDLLASFDRAALQAQLAQAVASAAAAQMLLAQAKTDRTLALRTHERIARLHSGGAISEADLESAAAAAELAAQRVETAEAQLAAQRANLALAQTNLEHTTIRSPIDGIVITRNVDPGQTVASVLQSPTLFTVAADLRKMRVIAAVDEADVGEVRVGQEASFTVNAFPERVFEGKLVELRSSPVVMQDVVTYGAVIEADNLDLALKPGMTASARIRTGSVRHVLRVPDTALRFVPPEQAAHVGDARVGVWVIDGERLKHIDVRAGLSDGELTEVTTPDLRANDRVIVDLTVGGRTVYEHAH